jgi:DNA-binding transcriptional ArsR family regulator
MRLHAPGAARLASGAVDQVTDVTKAGVSDPPRSPALPPARYDAASMVRVPAAVWRTRRFNPTARRVWAKYAKLDKPRAGNREGGCTLGVDELAEQLGLSPRTVDTANADLAKAGALHAEERVTGRGQLTSLRFAVPPKHNPGSLFVDVPVGAIDTVPGWQFPVLCELMMRLRAGLSVSVAEIADAVGLTPTRCGTYLRRLRAHGLVVISERTGRQGAHEFLARFGADDEFIGTITVGTLKTAAKRVENPVDNRVSQDAAEAVVGSSESLFCAPGDRETSAPGDRDSCAAYNRTVQPDPQVDVQFRSAAASPEVMGTQPDDTDETVGQQNSPQDRSGSGRKRQERKSSTSSGSRARRPKQLAERRPSGGQLRLVREVVLPHAGGDLLARLSPWQWRHLQEYVAGYLLEHRGEDAVRLAHRLRNAINRTGGADVYDAYSWLRAAATRRQGCADPNCEDGLLWDRRVACPACAARRGDRAAARRAQGARPSAPRQQPAVRSQCEVCERPFATGDGAKVCRGCREDQAEARAALLELAARPPQ